jgi:hypothetical protein
VDSEQVADARGDFDVKVLVPDGRERLFLDRRLEDLLGVELEDGIWIVASIDGGREEREGRTRVRLPTTISSVHVLGVEQVDTKVTRVCSRSHQRGSDEGGGATHC